MQAVLLMMAVVLAGAVSLEWRFAAEEEAPLRSIDAPSTGLSATSPPPDSPRVAPEGSDRISAEVATILARLLFEPSRRPVTAQSVPGAATERLPRLTGILVTPAGRRVIFAAVTGGRVVIASEGSRIGGFLVQAIGPDEVTILGPDGVHKIRPSYDTSGPAPAAEPARRAKQPPLMNRPSPSTPVEPSVPLQDQS